MSKPGSFSQSFTSTTTASTGTSTRPTKYATKKRKATQQESARRNRKKWSDFRRDDDDEDVDEHLCERCRKIDFEAVFGISPDEHVTEQGICVFDLGTLASFSDDGSCRLCSLFAHIITRNQRYEEVEPSEETNWYLRAFTTATLWNQLHSITDRAKNLAIVIALSRHSDHPSMKDRSECIDRGVLLPWLDGSTDGSDGQLACCVTTCPKKINYDRLQDMLSSCDSTHQKCKASLEESIAFPRRARVIDCDTRRVSFLEPGLRYLALSYVWGPKKDGDVPVKYDIGSEIGDDLPSTIEDALYVTQSLGMRYLWVDRYCVDQSQSEETQYQVSQMANIYSHAYVTLCALGSHDNIGIAGVSRDRKRQFRAQTQDLILSWTGPSIRRKLQLSKWRSRGWTYQESVLSRRCLFFTEYFSVLVCDSQTSPDNVVSNYFHNWAFNKESELYGDASSHGRVLHPAQRFEKHLQEFQRRQLSFATDTLNAFKGILSQLSVQSYWGIPIYKTTSATTKEKSVPSESDVNAGFVTGLCWIIKSSSYNDDQDRTHFPSWSWSGQKHATTLMNCLAGSRNLEVDQRYFSIFKPTVRIKNLDGNLINIRELSQKYAATRIIPEQTQYLQIRSIRIDWKIKLNSSRSWIDHGLDVYQVGLNGWWNSEYVGSLHLDPSYDSFTEPHDKCRGQEQVCKHLNMKSGTAILLASNPVRATWMVVKQTKEGHSLRKGIIVSKSSDKLRLPLKSPTENMLEYIILG